MYRLDYSSHNAVSGLQNSGAAYRSIDRPKGAQPPSAVTPRPSKEFLSVGRVPHGPLQSNPVSTSQDHTQMSVPHSHLLWYFIYPPLSYVMPHLASPHSSRIDHHARRPFTVILAQWRGISADGQERDVHDRLRSIPAFRLPAVSECQVASPVLRGLGCRGFK